MLFLKETRVETIIPMPQAIEAVEEALAETSRGHAVVLPRRRIHHTNRMLFGVLPGSFKGAMGAYLQTDRDRTIHHETVILYSVETGEPLILFQDCSINELRTGAAGGVGAKHLASAGGPAGGGHRQRETRLHAAPGGVRGAAHRYRQGLQPDPGAPHSIRRPRPRPPLAWRSRPRTAPRPQLEGSDIVITATNAQSPVFEGRSLRAGMHVTSIANGDKTRVREEIDRDTMSRAARVCVTSEGHGGAPMEAMSFVRFGTTTLTWDGVCELGDVILGNAPGRTTSEEITLFKLQGLGIMDLAVGLRAYEALKDSASVQRL